MKKFRFLAVLLATLVLCVCVFPQETSALKLYQYSISALRMKVNVPETLAVFTRDVKSSDPNLKLFGFTAKDLSALMKEFDYYLYALPADTSLKYDYTVSMITTNLSKSTKDLAGASIHDLASYMDSLAYSVEQLGAKVNDVQIKMVDPYLYIWVSYSITLKNNKTLASNFYWTVYNSQSISIILEAYDGNITDAMLKEHEAIVDSITFTKKAAPKKKSSKSSSSGNSQKTSFPIPGLPVATQS